MHESLKGGTSEWINEPSPSFKLNEPADALETAAGVEETVLEVVGDHPILTEDLLAAFEANKQQRKIPIDTKVPHQTQDNDSRTPSRRPSTASVRALFTPMASDSTSVVVQRASAAARMHVVAGLQDVISEPCLNARVLANRAEDGSYHLRPKSSSGSVHSTRMYKTSETVRIPRSRSLAVDPPPQAAPRRRLPRSLTITPSATDMSHRTGVPFPTTPYTPSPVSAGSSAGPSESGSSGSSSPLERHFQRSQSSSEIPRSSSKSFIGNVKAIFTRDSSTDVLTTGHSANTPAAKPVEELSQGGASRRNTMLRRWVP